MLREMSVRAIKVITPTVQAPHRAQGFLKLQDVRSRRGCKKVSIFCPFLTQFPQAASMASAGDEDSLSGTVGLLTAAALTGLFEERGNQGLQKVSKKHTFILTHLIFWPYIKEETTQKHLSD